ncbi:hypothetical protein MPSEU_000833300 [Mayamaea pseudoterrestris]|nr:hypothetical protein MPSEU_000833300 [Mayamaea pseudoterrestris]
MFSAGKQKLLSPSPPSSRNIELDLRAKQDMELDALRQRGLAKILNKHFTETTRKLAAEKAAADAALRDLERRKAQTTEFTPSSNSEISPLDALYLSVNQWRAECRRKEKETLLLYQRYVQKFASAGYVQVPGCAPLTPPRSNKNRVQATPPTTSTAASLTPGSTYSPAAPTPAKTPTPVPNLAAAIESTLEDYLKSGAISLPSIGQLGLDATYASEHEKEVQDFRNYYRQQLELVHLQDDSDKQQQGKLETTPEELEGEVEMEQEDFSANAPNNFLQSIENALEAKTPQKAGKIVTPGKEEEESITAVQDDDDEEADCFTPIDFLQRNNDSDSDSVVSGLTINSALTRKIIDDCERTVITFFHEEQAFVRQQMEMDEHMNASSSSHVGSMSEVQSVQMQAALQAESMAKQMKEILEKFERDQEQASATDTSGSVATLHKSKESRPYPTNNDNEDWVVLYDSNFDREYYHERNSGRTQWEPPLDEDSIDLISGSGEDATSSGTSRQQSVMLADAEVEPQVNAASRPVSRIALYRRKRRRQRRRRILAAGVLMGLCAVLGSVWVYYNSDSMIAKRLNILTQKYVQPLLDKYTGKEKTAAMLEELAREEADRLRVVAEEEERVARAKAEEERRLQLEREVAERKAREEETKRLKAAAAAEEQRRKKELAEAAAAEKAKKEAELWIQRQEEELRRPVGCNIPLAYAFHGKCRRLAKANPVFDFQGLVESMLQ